MKKLILFIPLIFSISFILSQDFNIYCDSLITANATIQLQQFQDTVHFSFNNIASNAIFISQNNYVFQWISLEENEAIDTIELQLITSGLLTYVYPSQTLRLDIHYKTETIPDNYSVQAFYNIYTGTVEGTCQIPFTLSFIKDTNTIDLNSLPEVSDLAVVLSNPAADTVIIGMHGGPTDMLYTGDFDFFQDINTFSLVEVQQYQHWNPTVLQNAEMTLEEGIVYNDTTVAMLKKVVNHYRAMDKTVVLIGHSFGAFILAEYVDDYGMDDLHRVIPMAGRLNMPALIWENFVNGYWAYFSTDGITPIIPPDQSPSSDWATMKIAAGMGYNRWVDSLALLDLSKLMYVYATHDEAVGRLVEEELTMLENTSARILKIENGDHGAPFDLVNMQQVLAFIREGGVVAIHEPEPANAKIYPSITPDYITVEVEKKGTLMIFNMTAQIVFQQDLSGPSEQVSLAALPAGFYIASFQTIDNEYLSKKIVLQK